MKQVLYWIGFRVATSQQAFIGDAFGSFNNVRMLTKKEISTMASNFSSRTQAHGRINFGTRRIKYIKAFTHWVHNFYRISGLPSMVGLSEFTFKPQLDRAFKRSNIGKSMANKTKSSAYAVSPGPLENKKQCTNWEEKFVNSTRSHIGANIIPLPYGIRANEEPDINGEHPDFRNKKVACAPLEGDIILLTGCLISILLYRSQPSSHHVTGSKQQ